MTPGAWPLGIRAALDHGGVLIWFPSVKGRSRRFRWCVGVLAGRPKDIVVATYPTKGANADAGTVVLAVSTGP